MRIYSNYENIDKNCNRIIDKLVIESSTNSYRFKQNMDKIYLYKYQ